MLMPSGSRLIRNALRSNNNIICWRKILAEFKVNNLSIICRDGMFIADGEKTLMVAINPAINIATSDFLSVGDKNVADCYKSSDFFSDNIARHIARYLADFLSCGDIPSDNIARFIAR